ncbi:MAG: hypothetical protein PHE54_03470 [Bacilli bacterium]|nr:hypothetical protein [Bacilli bacterium]
MTKHKKKMKLSKGEKFLYMTAVMSFVFTMILKIFCGANVGNLNITVEKLKYEITNQEKTNESLTMQFNELTSFDKIKDVLAEYGLETNTDNIIVINK